MSSLPALAPTASVDMPNTERRAGKRPNQVTPYIRRDGECLSWITPHVDCPSHLRPPNGWTGLYGGLDTELLWQAHPRGP